MKTNKRVCLIVLLLLCALSNCGRGTGVIISDSESVTRPAVTKEENTTDAFTTADNGADETTKAPSTTDWQPETSTAPETTAAQTRPAEETSQSEQETTKAPEGGLDMERYIMDTEQKIANYKKSVVNAPSEYPFGRKTYYLANDGNDSNNGLSPDSPWQTLQRLASAPLAYGDVVLFKRGDVFRGGMEGVPGVTYSAYGTGEKPRIYGSARNYADPFLWVETSVKNIYRLAVPVYSVGIIGFDVDTTFGVYSGTLGIMKYKGYAGFSSWEQLKGDLEFYSDIDSRVLYLYSDKGNPGARFSSIEIGERVALLNVKGDNVTVDNLAFMFTGSLGVSAHCNVIGNMTVRNLTVKNCIFAWIGGSVMSGTTRYGNAVQIFGGCDGFYVKNNWMYQIYDTGVTFQYVGNKSCVINNVHFTQNLIEYCHWYFEYYNADYAGATRRVQNVTFSDNICTYGGQGFGCAYRAAVSAMVASHTLTTNTENFVIANNVFYLTQGRIYQLRPGGDEKIAFENNLNINKDGAILGELLGTVYGYTKQSEALFKSRFYSREDVFVYLP